VQLGEALCDGMRVQEPAVRALAHERPLLNGEHAT